MAVSSIKSSWLKFSARIRDYLDAVDSYNRPVHDGDDGARVRARHSRHHHHHHHHYHMHAAQLSEAAAVESSGIVKPHHRCSHAASHERHSSLTPPPGEARLCEQRDVKAASTGNAKRNKSLGAHHHKFDNIEHRARRLAKQQLLASALQSAGCGGTLPSLHYNSSAAAHQHHHNSGTISQHSKAPKNYSTRKTSQGQIYFVDAQGQEHWYDPSVPRELLHATLDLDTLVGRLSANWEVRHTSSGKTYFVNHVKKTTQFTDPRLVVYKDHLMAHLKRNLLPGPINSQQTHLEFSAAAQQRAHQQGAIHLTPRVAATANHHHHYETAHAPQAAAAVVSPVRPLPPPPRPPSLSPSARSDSGAAAAAATAVAASSQTSNTDIQDEQACIDSQERSHQNASTATATATRCNEQLVDKIHMLRRRLLLQQNTSHSCKIEVSRKKIFEDSYRILTQVKDVKHLKKRLLVKFRNEEALDYGGVAREWFYLLSREILNPTHGLFQYTSDDNSYNLQINPDSGVVYREHLNYLYMAGRFVGMAVFHGHFIEGHFTLPFYKMLLARPITLEDIESVDPELYRSLCWMLRNDITNVIDTTFTVQHDSFGQLQERELCDDGKNMLVTELNKRQYVSLYVNYRCKRGIESQFNAFKRGFQELVAPSFIEQFDEHELELLICGLSQIDIDDWRAHTKLKNCTPDSPLVNWFWDVVRSYGEDKRARLLQFVTGSPRVPIQGFKGLQGINSELRPFTIHVVRNSCTDNLPKSHTCFNRLDMPSYETYDKLRDKLTQAIEETIGFAMQ